MGGLMVLIAIALFTGFCWLLSGWIIRNKAGKYYNLKRGVVFLIPALMPVYIQIVEYVLFQQACKEAVVYFPEKKPALPQEIVSGRFLFDDPIKDFDSLFEFVIAPRSNSKLIDLGQDIEQLSDYVVHSLSTGKEYKNNKNNKKDKKDIIEHARYLISSMSSSKKDRWYAYTYEIYIYDFEKKMKISRVIKVNPRSYQRSLIGFFHAKFNACPTAPQFDYSYANFIKNTFVMEDK